ncbi:hypothetical protein EON65_24265 [archaeon]|nr:MAG: hypothetical protein EON65_24265 [archaeon]
MHPGEMHRLSGSIVTTNPRIAYVAQEHWICNASVQDNVLFYSPLDEAGYRAVRRLRRWL